MGGACSCQLPPTAKADGLPPCYRCEQRAVVEREFQTPIEACIDIAQLLIAATNVEVPATNAATFARLNDLDILSADTAEIMQDAAGFRNVLAHQYGHDIDDEQVYRHLQSDLDWFPTFLREIRSELNLGET